MEPYEVINTITPERDRRGESYRAIEVVTPAPARRWEVRVFTHDAASPPAAPNLETHIRIQEQMAFDTGPPWRDAIRGLSLPLQEWTDLAALVTSSVETFNPSASHSVSPSASPNVLSAAMPRTVPTAKTAIVAEPAAPVTLPERERDNEGVPENGLRVSGSVVSKTRRGVS
jgi:anti-sigma-K factor RskA